MSHAARTRSERLPVSGICLAGSSDCSAPVCTSKLLEEALQASIRPWMLPGVLTGLSQFVAPSLGLNRLVFRLSESAVRKSEDPCVDQRQRSRRDQETDP